MTRSEDLANELTEQLRGLEDGAVKRIGGIFEEALKRTIRKVLKRLEQIDNQPEYDPKTTPGAFLGSTPTGPQRIEPVEKNQASLYLQGQLLQDLQALVEQLPLSRDQRRALDKELKGLFGAAQDLGTEYAQQLTQDHLQPALDVRGQQAPGTITTTSMIPGWEQWTPGEYQEGQRFTRLVNLSAAVIASERDFKSLSLNYRRQRDAATNDHVKASKDYYYKWWKQWGEDVSLEVATQLATGVDSRTLQRNLKERIPTINEAFKNRAEVVARTETLMAAGEAQERTYRKIGVGFAQYLATNDDRTCEWCAPRHGCLYWLGSVKAPIHPQCVLPGTEVSPGQVIAATRMMYRGPVVTIRTKSGRRLSCSQNHLVATPRGWVRAHLLQEGDEVLSQPHRLDASMIHSDLDQVPSRIEDVFDAAVAASGMAPVKVSVAPVHLHGDGERGEGEIEVVTANRELRDWLESLALQDLSDLDLQMATGAAQVTALGPLDLGLLRANAALGGFMGGPDLPRSLLSGHLGPLEQLRFLAAAWRQPAFTEPTIDHRSADPEQLREALDTAPSLVTADQILNIEIDPSWVGHVYDLSTISGAYVADGILTHNCRCTTSPITLEALVLRNSFATDQADHWEAEAQAMAAKAEKYFKEANGEKAEFKPIGGPGQARAGEGDYPLMEKTGLPQSRKRKKLRASDSFNVPARPWPSGDPVWCPRRGWLDPAARTAYEAIQREVAAL